MCTQYQSESFEEGANWEIFAYMEIILKRIFEKYGGRVWTEFRTANLSFSIKSELVLSRDQPTVLLKLFELNCNVHSWNISNLHCFLHRVLTRDTRGSTLNRKLSNLLVSYRKSMHFITII
jgi:hypothetical protein